MQETAFEFPAPPARTADEHRALIREVIRLSLYFAAAYQARHPAEPFADVLIRRTSIWEMTGQKNTPASLEWTAALGRLFEKDPRPEAVEAEGARLLEPHLERLLESGRQWERNSVAPYKGGSLRYDAPLQELPRNYCNFHITNAISPRSILVETRYTAGCFLKLMDDAEREFGFDVLRTMTWLNSAPPWLKFFPAEWHAHIEAPFAEIHGNLGFWGQILTARKTFSAKRGAYIRAHLALPYPPRAAHCPFAALRAHLNRLLDGQPV